MTARPHRGELWAADLDSVDPALARGRLRPVLVLQASALTQAGHPTTIVIPCNAPGQPPNPGDNFPLRVPLTRAGTMGADAELLVDQIRAIDNARLLHRLHVLPPDLVARVEQALLLLIGP